MQIINLLTTIRDAMEKFPMWEYCETLSKELEHGTITFPNAEPLPGNSMPVPCCFATDDGVAVKRYIIKLSPFNYRLLRARRILENYFSIITNKFRVLEKPINLESKIVTNNLLTICAMYYFVSSSNYSRRYYLDLRPIKHRRRMLSSINIKQLME